MNVFTFFKGIGRRVVKVFTIIRKVVPDELLAKGIQAAELAAEQFVDNAARREWVVSELVKVPGVSEHVARLVTELAVSHLKADVIDKAAGKAIDALD